MRRRLSRREVLRQLAVASAWSVPLLGDVHRVGTQAPATPVVPSPNDLPAPSYLTPRDDAFLEELEKAIFQYFWDQTTPTTGLTRDRCNVRSSDNGILGSIAATGFG
ncbi:MAG: hypothetical protein WA886_02320, partial [Candidatus Acidiferrales bacterium]